MRLLPLAVAAALVIPSLPRDASAQKDRREPARPKLESGADTNDPRAYYALGDRLLERESQRAADAFYWAMRLDPTSADAAYGRRTALLMADRRRLVRYLDGDRRTRRHAEVLRIDSLQVRALMANPFFYRKFERRMMSAYITEAINGSGPLSNQLSVTELEHILDTYLMRAGPAAQGWMAYADGRFEAALSRYAQALQSSKRKAYFQTERGRIFQMIGRSDSALAMLQAATNELRREDNDELVFLYDSKALLEYSIGKIHEARDRPQDAREAYGRALQEDLAFYPAHVALSALALSLGDTASVISEMELAVELQPDDPVIRLFYGYSLMQLGRHEAAVTQLERAVVAEPLFARPYQLLGEAHERTGDRARAIQRYEQFLVRASRNAPDYQGTAARIAELKNAGAGL